MILLMLSSNGYAASISNLYMFGDSLSDNGNMFSLSQHTVPSVPYYEGHFSNGQIWIEYLTNKLGLPPSSLHDFAFGGSLTNSVQPPGLVQQTTLYLDQHLNLDQEGLYVIWSGANNYLYMDALDESLVQKTVNDIVFVVSEMIDRGAHHLLLINLPPMDKTPWANMVDDEKENSNYSQMLEEATNLHNKKLAEAVQKLQTQSHNNHQIIHLMHFDMNKFFNEIALQAPFKDAVNTTTPCYTGDLFGRNGTICDDPENYLFWDTVHPTTQAHAIIADAILSKLLKDGIAADHNVLAKKYSILSTDGMIAAQINFSH